MSMDKIQDILTRAMPDDSRQGNKNESKQIFNKSFNEIRITTGMHSMHIAILISIIAISISFSIFFFKN